MSNRWLTYTTGGGWAPVGNGFVATDKRELSMYVVRASQARHRARTSAEEQLGEYGNGVAWLRHPRVTIPVYRNTDGVTTPEGRCTP